MKGLLGKSVESGLIVQRDALRSSELLRDVIERASFGLREAHPGEGEGDQTHGHEEQVDVRAADFLRAWERQTGVLFIRVT